MSDASTDGGLDEWMAAGRKLHALAPNATRWLAARLLELDAVDADAQDHTYDDVMSDLLIAIDLERTSSAAERERADETPRSP